MDFSLNEKLYRCVILQFIIGDRVKIIRGWCVRCGVHPKMINREKAAAEPSALRDAGRLALLPDPQLWVSWSQRLEYFLGSMCLKSHINMYF